MRPSLHARRRRGAFTLVEVLLAVAVFAIVLVAIHGVFYGAVRLRNKTTAALDEAVPLQQTLEILRRDLANLVLPGGTLSGELQTTPNTLNLSDEARQNLANFGGGDGRGLVVSPPLYTAVGIIDDTVPWGDVERVTYWLREPTNHTAGLDLVRSVARNLLPVVSEQPVEQWLMGGVQDLLFLFYDGTQWIDNWDSTTATNKLPLAIKVQIQLVARETDRWLRPPVELVVPIVLQAGTNQTAQATEEG
jgi:prepilin-type N-terminal cleavage/methylation domain-containing protein